jgi:hypothetical protein
MRNLNFNQQVILTSYDNYSLLLAPCKYVAGQHIFMVIY